MLAMQYGFDVADADAVRRRVSEIGHRFDQLPGLYFKAFLVADADATHAARYTPFYLWQDMGGMQQFLLSDGFRAVVAKYGRPAVGRWHQVELLHGDTRAGAPAWAAQTVIDIPAEEDIATQVTDAREETRALGSAPGLHSVYLGLDATSWQLMRISLWHAPPTVGGRVYEVRHLSAPGLQLD